MINYDYFLIYRFCQCTSSKSTSYKTTKDKISSVQSANDLREIESVASPGVDLYAVPDMPQVSYYC